MLDLVLEALHLALWGKSRNWGSRACKEGQLGTGFWGKHWAGRSLLLPCPRSPSHIRHRAAAGCDGTPTPRGTRQQSRGGEAEPGPPLPTALTSALYMRMRPWLTLDQEGTALMFQSWLECSAKGPVFI